MDSIIARARRGQATPQELAELNAWRAASSENERHYREVVWLLETLQLTLQEPFAPPRGADIIARGERRRVQAPRRVPSWVPWSVAAAAVLVAATQTWVRTTQAPISADAQPATQSAEIVTGEGELATVRMPDGSVARLAPRSRLRLLPSRTEREVWIQGRVFFAAVSNPDRPFRVRTQQGDLVALGTRFEVRMEPQGLRLSVVEGRVALIAQGERAEVGMGEAAAVRNGGPIVVAKTADLTDDAQWMRRFLAFQSTPLQSVAIEIERVYGRRVVLTDSSLGRQTVTATFTDEDLDQVVRVVCTVVGVRCAVTESHVTISR